MPTNGSAGKDQSPASNSLKQKRKVALALGGGAALGWAHIGIINELQARGIEIDAVAGTSIGAVVAACLAGGKLQELERIARSQSFRSVLGYLDISIGQGGMLGGRRIEKELLQHFGTMRIEDMNIPCAMVAADLITGEEVIFSHGGVVEAIRASLSIPGIFTPVLKDGRVLADGGLLNPVPVNVVRKLSSSPVIAVNLQGDYRVRAEVGGVTVLKPPRSLIGLSRVSIALLLAALSERCLKIDPADVVLAPAVGRIDVGDFTKAQKLIEIGRACAEESWPLIESLWP